MNIDDLKSEWNAVDTISKSEKALLNMLKENQHPVLKSIRRQIQIEVTAWSLFLLVYYSMFDGDKKPFWVNAVLVVTLMLPILHSVYGYFYNKYLTDGSDVKRALEQLYVRLKKYALISIFIRLGFAGGLMCFFTYNVNFNASKYCFLVLISTVLVLQIAFLCAIWRKRFKHFKFIISTFYESE